MGTTSLWPDVLGALVAGHDLSDASVEAVMTEILEGRADDAQIAAFAVALRAKGETSGELAGLVRTMRRFAEPLEVGGDTVDTCGTGGDRSGTFNVSTMAALIAAGAGVRVVKHGNRAASSRCGSADVLEELGVVIDLGPDGVAACVEEAGIGFCFAQRFHPAMRFAAAARRAIGVPTTFNFLGPLANPAWVRRQALGVGDPTMAQRMVGALAELGTTHALVFYGHDGLDELTTTTSSTVLELREGDVRSFDVDPTDLGLPTADLGALAGGDAADNADIVRRFLGGEGGPVRDLALLNAAAAIVVAGLADGLAEGLDRARHSVDDGSAADALESFIRTSGEQQLTDAS